jgi:hypothetical protein
MIDLSHDWFTQATSPSTTTPTAMGSTSLPCHDQGFQLCSRESWDKHKQVQRAAEQQRARPTRLCLATPVPPLLRWCQHRLLVLFMPVRTVEELVKTRDASRLQVSDVDLDESFQVFGGEVHPFLEGFGYLIFIYLSALGPLCGTALDQAASRGACSTRTTAAQLVHLVQQHTGLMLPAFF